MPIYTKSGDRGLTGLIGGRRVGKNSPVINALGALDEAVSYLGVVRSQKKIDGTLNREMKEIQKNLMLISSILAGSTKKFSNDYTIGLEKKIDRLENKIAPQKGFVIPGDFPLSAHLMFARSLVRRAERAVVFLNKPAMCKIQNMICSYINRLSDYLFLIAQEYNERQLGEYFIKRQR